MRIATVLVLAVLNTLLFAEEPDAVYRQGIARLRDAQSDHSALVPATKLLAQAAALYEAAGDEAKTAEVNSCLYWARKKFTLADAQAVKGDAVAVQRIEAVAKAVPVSEAKAMLDKAEAFAKGRADDPLLVSIRFFEVADRFPDAPEGKKAMQQSLAAMQKVGEKAKLETYKPAPTDGKAFIKSEPPGAAIILVTADGGKLDTGKVTPALIQLPVGKQSLELTLKGRKPATLAVEVDGKAIAKPEAATLEPLTIPIDIVFEDGWTVFVDGKPAKAVGTGKAETPCTAELPLGGHELGLGKEGFIDIKQRVDVVEGGVKRVGALIVNSVEIKSKPIAGSSALLKSVPKPVFLCDLSEADVDVWGGLGKNGNWTAPDGRYALACNGKAAEHGLLTHPSSAGKSARVAYALDGQYRLLQGAVAINDAQLLTCPSPITFKIIGDGKTLWESRPVSRNRSPQEFRVEMTGVRKLVLRVEGAFTNAHAIWIDPALSR